MRWPLFRQTRQARQTGRRRTSAADPRILGTTSRPSCAMVALYDGAPAGAEPCPAAGCTGAGRCPVVGELHRLAGHLQRVRRQVEHERSQPSMTGRAVRLTAGRLAYADLLQQACALLHVPTELANSSGIARELEILRVEAVLARYGVSP